jgi:nitrogen regulatory protein PII
MVKVAQSEQQTRKTSEREPMKQVTAIIKPFRLNEVRDALNAIGVSGLTVTQVQGYGRQRGQGAVYRGPEYEVKFIPKLKIEVLVATEHAEKVFATILKEARTGQLGDGKIYIQDVEKVARIRTGEMDSEAV